MIMINNGSENVKLCFQTRLSISTGVFWEIAKSATNLGYYSYFIYKGED